MIEIDRSIVKILKTPYYIFPILKRTNRSKLKSNINSNNDKHDEHNAWSTIPKIGGQTDGEIREIAFT